MMTRGCGVARCGRSRVRHARHARKATSASARAKPQAQVRAQSESTRAGKGLGAMQRGNLKGIGKGNISVCFVLFSVIYMALGGSASSIRRATKSQPELHSKHFCVDDQLTDAGTSDISKQFIIVPVIQKIRQPQLPSRRASLLPRHDSSGLCPP